MKLIFVKILQILFIRKNLEKISGFILTNPDILIKYMLVQLSIDT